MEDEERIPFRISLEMHVRGVLVMHFVWLSETNEQALLMSKWTFKHIQWHASRNERNLFFRQGNIQIINN